jgi:DNA polymerase-3 subunit chi
MSATCQVDFYLLARPELDAGRMACKLALMAWERGHHAIVVADSEASAAEIDALMWASPPDRFLPHELDHENKPGTAPVLITLMSRLAKSSLNEKDVVINLCAQPVPEPARFNRLLEIVPYQNDARQASREKFRYYRDQGISPGTHEINK